MLVRNLLKRRSLEVLSLAALGMAGYCASPAAAQTVQSVTPVPDVDGSHPYLAAAHLRAPEDLGAVGYTEQEYFISGLANAYKYNNPSNPMDDSVSTLQPNPEPYTNRILVRAPKDPAKFSGNVILDLGDDVDGIETPGGWIEGHQRFVQNGDAYVLLTSLPIAIQYLQTFNAQRYAPLSTPTFAATQGACQAGPEFGIIYDEITAVGKLLKSNRLLGPLPGLDVKRVFLTGYSGSTFTALTWDRVFGINSPLFDGYMLTYGSPRRALNSCESAETTYSRTTPGLSTVSPVIQTQSITEFGFFQFLDIPFTKGTDSDSPTNRFRYYEIAGASHIDGDIIRGSPAQADLPPAVSDMRTTAYALNACSFSGSTVLSAFPDRYPWDAIWANLENWAILGTSYVPPRQASPLVINSSTLYGPGPQIGGVRSPAVDLPIDSYVISPVLPADLAAATEFPCLLIGFQQPLGRAVKPAPVIVDALHLASQGFLTLEDLLQIEADPQLAYTYSDGTTTIPDDPNP